LFPFRRNYPSFPERQGGCARPAAAVPPALAAERSGLTGMATSVPLDRRGISPAGFAGGEQRHWVVDNGPLNSQSPTEF